MNNIHHKMTLSGHTNVSDKLKFDALHNRAVCYEEKGDIEKLYTIIERSFFLGKQQMMHAAKHI